RELTAVIAKLLQKQPDRRYASATELLTDLYDLMAGNRPAIALGPEKPKKKAARADVEIDEAQPPPAASENYWLTVTVLGVLLALSVAANVFLLLRRM